MSVDLTIENSEPLYTKKIDVRWADCDANRHMRHSAYSDMCADTRIAFLSEIGMTPEWFEKNKMGPVLFREETDYKKEAHMGERMTVAVEVGEPTGFTKTVQMLQRLYNAEGELSAEHRCVVGFMDLSIRKVVELPEKIKELYLLDTEVVPA